MQPAWKRNEVKNRGLFYKLFLSYVVFLVLPVVLFFVFVNSGLLKYAEETVDKANVSKLGLVENNIEASYAGMRDAAFRVVEDDRVKALFQLEFDRDTGVSGDMSKMFDAFQIFAEIRKDNVDIVSIYVYDRARDIVFSLREGVYAREKFYDTQWIASADSEGGETILRVRTVDDGRRSPSASKQSVITYILPLRYMNLDGAVAINITPDAFARNFVSASGGAQEGYAVVDRAGNVIIDENARLKNDKLRTPDVVGRVMGMGGSAGSVAVKAGAESYLVMYRRAPNSVLTIVNTIPLNAQFDKVLYYRMLLYVIAGITILLGVFVSYILAARLYNPVKKMLEKLRNQVAIDPRYRNNELNIISDAINELISNSLKDRQIIEDDRRHLRESYVMGLVMGQATDAVDYDFLDGNACCVLVSIDRFEAFSAAYSYREQYYYKSLILKVCEQVIALRANGAGAILEQEKIALIVSSGAAAGELEGMLRDICEGIAGEMSAIQDFTISLGVGRAYDDREDMRKSFMEASAALKYRLVFGHRSILFYGDVGNRHGTYAFPIEKQNRLFNHLKLNTMQEICPLLEETTADMKNPLNRQASADSIMRVFTQLLARTMEYLDAEGIDRDAPFGDRDLTYELTGKETLDEICVWMAGMFRGIVAWQEAHRQRPYENDHVNKIVAMIRDNYMDSNLSIEFVADKLGLSYSHVRKIFKESIGMNFVDYLNRMRIASAKQLLLKTDDTIKEIAEKSGYNNDQCLTRFFKRYEGITPGKYRLNWSQMSAYEDRKTMGG